MNIFPRKTYSNILNALKKKVHQFQHIVQHSPFVSFLGLLLLLLVVIALGNKLRQPPKQAMTSSPLPKSVQLYQFGAVPTLRVQAKIEKSGVIKLIAHTAGVVQKVWQAEGSHVRRSQRLFSLSTSYQGGNVADISRQLAQRNSQFLSDTYAEQQDTINKQRDLATKMESQAGQLRSITRQSFDETNTLINLDQTIIDGLNKQIQQLQSTNINGVNDAMILQLQEVEAGSTASINGARQSLRSNQYLADDTKEPAQVAIDQRNITLQQLDMQQKMLDLNKDLSTLNVRMADINESLMFPASPCPGVIERVYVHVGQAVSPGTVLAEIRGDVNTATAIVAVSNDVAQTVSRVEPSHLLLGDQSIALYPRSISTEPTEGSLNSVIFSIPETFAPKLSDGSSVEMDLPFGALANAHQNFLPIDAVYQTQDTAYVYIAENNQGQLITKNRLVQLGEVFGQYVQVASGIQKGDRVILNRNVVEGDQVTAQ